MDLKGLDVPKSLCGLSHYLILFFYKYALFIADLESSSGFLKTITKMYLIWQQQD